MKENFGMFSAKGNDAVATLVNDYVLTATVPSKDVEEFFASGKAFDTFVIGFGEVASKYSEITDTSVVEDILEVLCDVHTAGGNWMISSQVQYDRIRWGGIGSRE